jgi:hypothetical protein
VQDASDVALQIVRTSSTAKRSPAVLLVAALILTLLELAAVGLTVLLASAGMGRSAWLDVFAPHLAGWLAVWWYLLRRHRELPAEFRVAAED